MPDPPHGASSAGYGGIVYGAGPQISATYEETHGALRRPPADARDFNLLAFREEMLAIIRNMEHRIAALESRGGVGIMTEKYDGDKPQDEEEIQEEVLEDAREYEIQESVWDAFLVAGLHTEWGDTVFLVILMLINLLIQVVFCLIVAENMITPSISTQTLQELAVWRMVVGHKALYWDRATNTSLVSRTCQNTNYNIFAANQATLNANLANYKVDPGFAALSSPPTLCIIALIFWLLTCAGDAQSTLDYARGVLCIPKAKWTKLSDKGDTLEQISYVRTVCLILFVILPKLCIAATLACLGTLWLIHTHAPGDLILNAVALAFVLDTDEFLWGLLAPQRVQLLMSKVGTLPISHDVRLSKALRRRLPVRGLTMFLVVATFLCIIVPTWLNEEIRLSSEAERILCSGVQNFVYIRDAASGVVNIAMTEDASASSPQHIFQDYTFRAVMERTRLEAKDTLEGVIAGYDLSVTQPSSLDSMLTATFGQASDNYSCTDSIGEEEGAPNYPMRAGLMALIGVSNCSLITEAQCWDPQIRVYCPVRCHCNTGAWGIFDRLGCSVRCQSHVQAELQGNAAFMRRQEMYQDGICKDLDNSVEAYVRYFDGLQSLLVIQSFLEADDQTGRIVMSDTQTRAFAFSTFFDYIVPSTTSFSLGEWARTSFNYGIANFNASDSETISPCTLIALVARMFGLNACDEQYTNRIGDLRYICTWSCGLCAPEAPPPINRYMWSDLYQWTTAVGIPVIQALNDSMQCAIYGAQAEFASYMYWC